MLAMGSNFPKLDSILLSFMFSGKVLYMEAPLYIKLFERGFGKFVWWLSCGLIFLF
jgi:hypothetical protein